MRKTDKKLVDQTADLTNKWKRALADYQNLEKRTAQEKEEFAKYASCELILKILLGLDSLEAAQSHLKDEGLNLAIKQLKDGLKQAGVEETETLGKKFDPEYMECLELTEGEEGKVLDETRKGYKLGNRVIRTALVRVGKQKGEN